MGDFINFIKQKLDEQNSKKVSSNLVKNIIDVLKEYISTEYDLTEDEKIQIISNMKISIEEHNKGILKKGPRFVASSSYEEGGGKSVPVEITIEIITDKIGKKQEVKSVEEQDEDDNEE